MLEKINKNGKIKLKFMVLVWMKILTTIKKNVKTIELEAYPPLFKGKI